MTHWGHVLIAFVQYSGLIILIGSLATRNIKSISVIPAFSVKVESRVNIILVFALVALTVCAPFVLAIRATMMTGSGVTEILPALSTILLQTHYGLVWLIRCALLLVSWLFILPLIKTNKQWISKFMFVVACFIAWTISAAGHASGWDDFSWQQLTDWLHIVSASLWGGGMISLLFVIWPLLHVDVCQDFISHAAIRLSRLATKVFIITIVTGLVNLYLQLLTPGDLVNTSYGEILFIKISLVLMMLYFAFINRYRYLTQLQQTAELTLKISRIARFFLFFAPAMQRRFERTAASRYFYQLLILETLCLFAVLACTAILRHGPPPPHMM